MLDQHVLRGKRKCILSRRDGETLYIQMCRFVQRYGFQLSETKHLASEIESLRTLVGASVHGLIQDQSSGGWVVYPTSERRCFIVFKHQNGDVLVYRADIIRHEKKISIGDTISILKSWGISREEAREIQLK